MKIHLIKPLFVLLLVLGLTMFAAGSPWASNTKVENIIERISPEDARQQVQAGKALLVCSYDDDSCGTKMLQGAIFRSQLEAQLETLPKEQPIIFYCS